MLLKLNTAVSVKMGAFVDIADGVTPMTALTPTVRISKNGGAWVNRNSATAITHDESGFYNIPLSATDTNTLGTLVLLVSNPSVHLPVWLNLDVTSVGVSGGVAAEVWAYVTRTLTAGLVPAVVNPVNPSTLEVTIVRGDDYITNPIQFTGMPDLTGATVVFRIGDLDNPALAVETTCTYLAGTVSVELDGTLTETLLRSNYQYTLLATTGSNIRSVAIGKLVMKGKVNDAA
jgi:hypothetical protein